MTLEDYVIEALGAPLLQAEVVISIGPDRRSSFRCPKCERTIPYRNAFPLSFQWKVCPRCRVMWMPNGGPQDFDIHADQHVGEQYPLQVFALDRSVDRQP